MPPINCIVPLQIKISGGLHNLDENALGDCIADAVHRRLLFASRQLTTALATVPPAVFHQPEIKLPDGASVDEATPLRNLILNAIARGIAGGAATAFNQPRFQLADFKSKASLPKLPDPWSISFRSKFSIRLRDFADFSFSTSAGRKKALSDRITSLYADRLDEIFHATAWIVTVNQATLLDDLAEEITARVQDLAENSNKPLGWVWSPYEVDRAELKRLAQDGGLAKLPSLLQNRGGWLPSGKAYLLRGDKLLFVFLALPVLEFDTIATRWLTITSWVAIKDMTPWINQPQFKQFFGIEWSSYVQEFGSTTALFWIVPFTTKRNVRAETLRYLLLEEAAEGLSEEQAVFGHLQLLNAETVTALPLPARQAFQQGWSQSPLSTIPSARAEGVWEPGWFGAYIYAMVRPSAEEKRTTRYRPGARRVADKVIELLKKSRETPWAFRLLDLLYREFQEHPQQEKGSPQEAYFFFLQELEEREGGRWFFAFFDGVEEAHVGDLFIFVLQRTEQTQYSTHPRVERSRKLFNARRESFLKNSYDAKTKVILLNRDPSQRLDPGDFIRKPLSAEVKRIKPDRLAVLQKAVEATSFEIIKGVLNGTDTKTYSMEEFGKEALTRAAKAVGFSDDDLEEVTVQRYLKYLDLKYENNDGVDRYWVTYELYDRIGNEQLTLVENSRHTASEFDFEFLLWAWEFEVNAAFWDTAIKVVSVAGVLVIAWEIGAIAVLVELAGGGLTVGISIGISELIYLCTAKHYSLEGFLLAALEGYLGALGFRFGFGAGSLVAKQIGTESLRRVILGWVAERIAIGAVGGASSAFLITFSNDLIGILLGRQRGLHPIGDYVRAMTTGAAFGVLFEFGGSALGALLPPLARGLWSHANEIFDHLQLNGIGLLSWLDLSSAALRNLTEHLGSVFDRMALVGVSEAFAEHIAEITHLMEDRLQLSVLQRILQLRGFTPTAAVQRGLGRLVSGLGGRFTENEIFAFISRLEKNPAQLRRMLEALEQMDEAALRSLSNTTELDAFAENFLPTPPVPKPLPKPAPPAPPKPPKPRETPATSSATEPEVKPPSDPVPALPRFKAMDDILKPDKSGFLDPALDGRYRDYRAEKLRKGEGPAKPELWARRQTSGQYRDMLERELGPDFNRQGGGGSIDIDLADIPRPGNLSEPKLQTALTQLHSRLGKVFERLGNLRSRGIADGLVNSGHFNIAKGNVAEVLSEPIQQRVLNEIRKLHPKAEIISGVRIRIAGDSMGEVNGVEVPGPLSDSKLYTDNLIGEWQGNDLVVHGKFEVKSGPRGGSEATTQIFEWVEGRLTDGSVLIVPGHPDVTWNPIKNVPRVKGLSSGSKAYIIAAEGSELYGSGSDMQTALEHGRLPLPYSASEIDYLTRLIIETLAQ